MVRLIAIVLTLYACGAPKPIKEKTDYGKLNIACCGYCIDKGADFGLIVEFEPLKCVCVKEKKPHTT
ncbi:MAG: hypothetical protein WC243_03835 [Patescibacteria group bacterium]|jgi:hypothetical protein